MALNPGFLLAEDAAVKRQFSQITVSDDKHVARPVKVFFRYPEAETEREYPFITIELIDVVHAKQRQHSIVQLYGSTSQAASVPATESPTELKYWPSTSADLTAYAALGENVTAYDFLPVDLMYQVSTYSRSALHDRQLSSQILSRAARFRFGWLPIPEDGTLRRFDLLDWVTADLLDPEAGYRKRIFRKVYTVQMNAELTVTDLDAVTRVLSITTDIIESDSHSTETVITP